MKLKFKLLKVETWEYFKDWKHTHLVTLKLKCRVAHFVLVAAFFLGGAYAVLRLYIHMICR